MTPALKARAIERGRPFVWRYDSPDVPWTWVCPRCTEAHRGGATWTHAQAVVDASRHYAEAHARTIPLRAVREGAVA